MSDLRQQLTTELRGRVCWVGLGNTDHSDDGFGVYLAERLFEAGFPDVVIAGNAPDRYMGEITARGFDHVVFIDAVEFAGSAGSAIFVNASEIVSRFPQISTHKISLSLLAQWIEGSGKARAWLLGVQPRSIARGEKLTPTLQTTLTALFELLSGLSRSQEVLREAAGARK